MIIRQAIDQDKEGIWEIFSKVIAGGDTYVYPPDTPREQLDQLWFAPPMHTYVAVENRKVLGSYIFKPNQPGLGEHIANASYMVHPEARGKGIGGKLCAHSLEEARKQGYTGMQFNIVVSTNTAAIHLWKKFGFKIIGTTPNGFQHQKLGLVDTYVMFLKL